MPSLAQQFDTSEAVKTVVLPPAPIATFVAAAGLHPEAEIQSEYEKVYDAHWRVRDAQHFGKPAPADVQLKKKLATLGFPSTGRDIWYARVSNALGAVW